MGPSRVKTVEVFLDQLTQINTAVGIATILQFPDPVQTVIIGDQGAFKIEYLDKAITIKPLRYSAKTNLYVNTATRRYNLKLVTQSQDLSDYVVYIKAKNIKAPPSIIWREFKRSVKSEDLILLTRRIGQTKDGFVLIDFQIKSNGAQKIDPEWFWIFQGKDHKVMQGLYLSSGEVKEKTPIQGIVTLNLKDFESDVSATFKVKTKTAMSLELPREVLWRK